MAWPMAAVLGFLTLIGLDIVLGMRSTARFEFDRNQVQQRQRPVAVPAARPVAAAASPAAGGAAVQPAGGIGQPAALDAGALAAEAVAAASMAAHPAGKRAARTASPAGWWLVDEPEDGGPGQVLAGPFPDRMAADWAALSGSFPAAGTPRPLHGVRRGAGVVRRPSPEEQAWLAVLGEQLNRLGDDWDTLLTDNDPLTTLAVEVTAALVEAGLGLHDCAGGGPSATGGVCLTPQPASGGILVSWHQHDRVNRDRVHGATAEAAVQELMNGAVAGVLAQLGFDVEPLSTGCHLVTLAE